MSAGSIGQQIINGTYGLDNRSSTAYEELKAWCEKHLPDKRWSIIACSNEKSVVFYCRDGETSIVFDEAGEFDRIESIF